MRLCLVTMTGKHYLCDSAQLSVYDHSISSFLLETFQKTEMSFGDNAAAAESDGFFCRGAKKLCTNFTC